MRRVVVVIVGLTLTVGLAGPTRTASERARAFGEGPIPGCHQANLMLKCHKSSATTPGWGHAPQ